MREDRHPESGVEPSSDRLETAEPTCTTECCECGRMRIFPEHTLFTCPLIDWPRCCGAAMRLVGAPKLRLIGHDWP